MLGLSVSMAIALRRSMGRGLSGSRRSPIGSGPRLGRQHSLHKGAGGEAADPFEMHRQMALDAKAGMCRHVCDAGVANLEEFLGFHDAAADEVLVRRQARGLFEHSGKMKGTQSGDAGESG